MAKKTTAQEELVYNSAEPVKDNLLTLKVVVQGRDLKRKTITLTFADEGGVNDLLKKLVDLL